MLGLSTVPQPASLADALVFLVIAAVAGLLGFSGLASGSAVIAKVIIRSSSYWRC